MTWEPTPNPYQLPPEPERPEMDGKTKAALAGSILAGAICVLVVIAALAGGGGDRAAVVAQPVVPPPPPEPIPTVTVTATPAPAPTVYLAAPTADPNTAFEDSLVALASPRPAPTVDMDKVFEDANRSAWAKDPALLNQQIFDFCMGRLYDLSREPIRFSDINPGTITSTSSPDQYSVEGTYQAVATGRIGSWTCLVRISPNVGEKDSGYALFTS